MKTETYQDKFYLMAEQEIQIWLKVSVKKK